MGKFTSLEKSKLTCDWSLEERAALAYFLEKKEVASGARLFKESTIESQLYFLDKGEVELDSKNIRISLEAGDSFGELSLFQETSKKLGALAQTECTLWVLSKDKYLEICDQHPSLAHKLQESVLKKLSGLLSSGIEPPDISQLKSQDKELTH